jgi:L-arabinonolactonase
VLYYVDSGGAEPALYCFGYDLASGRIKELHEKIQFDCSLGVPDGLVVDQQGFLWMAFWGGGVIGKLSSGGQLLSIFEVPVKFPTCLAFGGEQLKDLYLTTSKETCEPEDDLAGHLFRAVAPSVGMKQPRFQWTK